MNWKRLVLIISFVLAAAFVLSGCGRNTVATVNGDPITKDEYYSRLERITIPVRGQNVQAGPMVLNQMIMDEIWVQLAKKKGVSPTKEQIESKIRWQQKGEDLAIKLKQQGLSLEEYKKLLVPRLAQFNVMTKGITVSEAEMRNFYEKNKRNINFPIFKPKQVRLGLIICTSKAKADQAYAQLKDGKDFRTVASALSEEAPSAQRGGEYGWVAKLPKERLPLPEEWVNAAFNLRVNDFSAPIMVKSPQQGTLWGIVRPLQFRPETVLSYNDSKDFIRDYLLQYKAMQAGIDVNKMFATEFANAEIKIRPERYKGMQLNLEKSQKQMKAELNKKP